MGAVAGTFGLDAVSGTTPAHAANPDPSRTEIASVLITSPIAQILQPPSIEAAGPSIALVSPGRHDGGHSEAPAV
jgi:hypothetical protein